MCSLWGNVSLTVSWETKLFGFNRNHKWLKFSRLLLWRHFKKSTEIYNVAVSLQNDRADDLIKTKNSFLTRLSGFFLITWRQKYFQNILTGRTFVLQSYNMIYTWGSTCVVLLQLSSPRGSSSSAVLLPELLGRLHVSDTAATLCSGALQMSIWPLLCFVSNQSEIYLII